MEMDAVDAATLRSLEHLQKTGPPSYWEGVYVEIGQISPTLTTFLHIHYLHFTPSLALPDQRESMVNGERDSGHSPAYREKLGDKILRKSGMFMKETLEND